MTDRPPGGPIHRERGDTMSITEKLTLLDQIKAANEKHIADWQCESGTDTDSKLV